MVIFIQGVCVVGVGNEFKTNIVPLRTLRVTINEISIN